MTGETFLDSLQAHTATVHTKSGDSIKGALMVYDDCFVIRQALLLDGDAAPTALGDLVTVLRSEVRFFQVSE